MHLKSNDIAFAGIMTALSVIFIMLGCYIDSSTVFFLAAGAYLTGVVEYNCSFVLGLLHTAASFAAGFMLAPDKLYCLTFLCFSIYILAAEYLEAARFKKGMKTGLMWGLKCLAFQILFVAALLVYRYFFGLGDVLFIAGVIAAGEVFWIVYDRAYVMFQRKYGKIFRKKGR